MIAKWRPDIVFLQEVKLVGPCLAYSLSNIWRNAHFIYTSHREGRGKRLLV